MSSHREAPEIGKDPVADNTDVYAFVSPDNPDKVTIVANYIRSQDPAGGPNFYEFGDDVVYEINIDNDGDGKPDIDYQFRFTTVCGTPTRSCTTRARSTSLDGPNWNRRQIYRCRSTTDGIATARAGHADAYVLGEPAVPAVQRRAAVDAGLRRARRGRRCTTLPTRQKVFAGQRPRRSSSTSASIFDLGTCGRSRTCT